MNLKSSPGVYHYQSLTQEQKILSMNKSGIIWHWSRWSINESDITTRLYHYQSFTQEQMILSMNLKSSPSLDHYQSFRQEQMILITNLKSPPGVYHYQSFTQLKMILSINLKSSPSVYHYQSFRWLWWTWWNDDSCHPDDHWNPDDLGTRVHYCVFCKCCTKHLGP